MKYKILAVILIFTLCLSFFTIPSYGMQKSDFAQWFDVYKPEDASFPAEILGVRPYVEVNGQKHYLNRYWVSLAGEKRKLVYGEPFGWKDGHGYRYLGYNENGQPFTNQEFIPDTNSKFHPNTKAWVHRPWTAPQYYQIIGQGGNLPDPQNGTVLDSTPDWMVTAYTTIIGNYTFADFGLPLDKLHEYAVVTQEPTRYSEGAITVYHLQGTYFYLTLTIDPLETLPEIKPPTLDLKVKKAGGGEMESITVNEGESYQVVDKCDSGYANGYIKRYEVKKEKKEGGSWGVVDTQTIHNTKTVDKRSSFFKTYTDPVGEYRYTIIEIESFAGIVNKQSKSVYVTVTGGPKPEPEPGEGGHVEITFSPNSTQEIGGKTKDNHSYWVNKDIPVKVTATGEIEVTSIASRSYTFTYEWEEEGKPGPNGEPGEPVTKTGRGTGSEDCEMIEVFVPDRLEIGGTAGVNTTIANGRTITITKEEMNMILTGRVVGWRSIKREWVESGDPSPSAPQGEITSVSWSGGNPPPGPEPSDDFPAESGHYSLDKTPPVIKINYSPQRNRWSNRDFNIAVTASDASQQGAANVSGMENSQYSVENLAYTGSQSFTGTRKIPHNHSGSYTYTEGIVINRDGVYEMPIQLQDLAGNLGIIQINGSQASTNGSWVEGDFPLDKTDPEPARFSLDPNNLFGYTKSIANVPQKPASHRVAGEPQGFEFTVDQRANQILVHIDDNLSGTGDRATYDTLTRSDRFQYAWSKSYDRLTEPGGWQSFHSDYQSTNALLSEHIQPAWRPPGYGSHLGRTTLTLDPHHQVLSYRHLKEGLWYLHIRQEDRAGNETITVSPPIQINKLKNLRITAVADYRWEELFQTSNRSMTPLQYQGIRVREFPIYQNKRAHGVALGYETRYKIDTVGFEEPGDAIQITVQYHGLDQQRNLYKDVDVYLLNKKGNYVRIDDLTNPQWDESIAYYYHRAKVISFTPGDESHILYEADRELESLQRSRQEQDLAQGKYRTIESSIFLPHHARFVEKGKALDLIEGKHLMTYELLVTFDVKGIKGHGLIKSLDYTQKEDQWAETDVWYQQPPTRYNSYGKNRRTNLDLLNKGRNHGEFIWWQLYRTIQDDFRIDRRW